MPSEQGYPLQPGRAWPATMKLIVGVIFFVLVLLAAYRFRGVFFPLIIGAITAFIFYPVAHLISRLTRLPHAAATAILYLALLALLIPLAVILIPLIVGQLQMDEQLILGFLSSLDMEATITLPFIDLEVSFAFLMDELTLTLSRLVSEVLTQSLPITLNAAQIVLFTFFTILIGYYLTRDGLRFINQMLGLVPADYRDDAAEILHQLNELWAAFLRGQLILALTVTVILSVVAAILGLPQPVLIGLWGGVLEFLPSVGHAIWGITVMIVAYVAGSSHLAIPNATLVLIVLIVYLAFTQLDLNILIPTIIGGQVHLHPALVLVGVILGLEVGGVLGVALAAPTLASLRIVGRYLYAKLFDLEPFEHLLQNQELATDSSA